MKTQLVLCILLMASMTPSARSQVLHEDPIFSDLHFLGWNMSMRNIRDHYEEKQQLEHTSDSTLTIKSKFFGIPAQTEIRFQQSISGPRLINIKFGEPSKGLVDSLTNHFTRLTQRAPTTSHTEKKIFTMTLRIDMARWRSSQEAIVLTTALRDGTISDVGLIITKAAEGQD
jgi:hypothetical protein